MNRVLKNEHGELRCGWSIFLLMILQLVMQVVIGIVFGIVLLITSNFDAVEITATQNQVLMIIHNPLFSILILLLFWVLYRRKPSKMGLSLQGFGADLSAGLIIGALSISAVALITLVTGTGEAVWVGFTEFNTRFILMELLLHITVGLMEEILARGYLMTVSKTSRNRWLIIGFSGIFFAVLHLFNQGVTVLSLINIALIGFVFAVMFERRGNIWMPVGFHFIWNFMQGSLYGSKVSGTEARGLFQLTQRGSEILTGGEFGFEGSIFTTIVTALLLLVMIFVYPKSKNPQWTIDGDLPLLPYARQADTINDVQQEVTQ